MVNDFILENYEQKISCHAQIGGIDSYLVNNGPSAGTDISVFNTGGGLRFRVMSGNGLDIADAFFNQFCLSSMNPMGPLVTAGGPYPGLTRSGFMKSWFGKEKPDRRYMATSVESVRQPDPQRGIYSISLSGKVFYSTEEGPVIRLSRNIGCVLGMPKITVTDTIVNTGAQKAKNRMSYIFNLGYPLVDDCCLLTIQKKRDDDAGSQSRIDLNTPVPVLVTPETDRSGIYRCTLSNPKIGISMHMNFRKAQFQHLEIIPDLKPGRYSISLVPKISADADSMPEIEPGEEKTYSIEIEISRIQKR